MIALYYPSSIQIPCSAADCQIPAWAWALNGTNVLMQLFLGAFTIYYSAKLHQEIRMVKIQICTNLDLHGNLLAHEM